jgi:ferric-dicitrate binding protein FerR (iron transport regulator)
MSVEHRAKGRAMADGPVVVNSRDSSAGALVAGIVAVLLIALAVWYFGFRGADTESGTGVDVDVTVQDGSGGETTPAP